MGIILSEVENKNIVNRIPYTIAAAMVVPNGTTGQSFPAYSFANNIKKAVEIHRIFVRFQPFDNASPPTIVTPNFLVKKFQA